MEPVKNDTSRKERIGLNAAVAGLAIAIGMNFIPRERPPRDGESLQPKHNFWRESFPGRDPGLLGTLPKPDQRNDKAENDPEFLPATQKVR